MIEKIARFGYAAKGAVYLLVGYLSGYAAWSGRKPPSGSKGAMAQVLAAPFGEVVLAVVTAGLCAYVVWRLIQAIRDPEGKGVWMRLFYLGIAIVYSSAALAALRLVTEHRRTGDAGPAPVVAFLLDKPFGQWAVMALALGIFIFALGQLKQGFTSSFVKKLRLSDLPASWTPAAIWTGRIGLTARGLAFSAIALLVWRAAIHHRASEAQGMGGALRTFQQQPWGDAALGSIGVGLAIYGIYSLVLARCRRIDSH